MFRKLLSVVLCLLLVQAAGLVSVCAQGGQEGAGIEKVKQKLAKIGVGEKARATVHLKNGTKLKGYIYQAGDDNFVLRDRKTDAPTTISYTDVAKVDSNRGHSLARNLGLGIAIGAGAVLVVIAVIISSLDD